MLLKALLRNLFYSPLPAAIAWFTIMFAGDSLARAEKKPAAHPITITSTSRIPVEGLIAKP